MDAFVPDHAIDREEVYARGGRNFGDEDFALFRCPNCGQIYLVDRSAEVAYVNPRDAGARIPVERVRAKCVGCGAPLGEEPLTGPAAPESVRVTWDQLRATRWAWVATTEAMLRNQKRTKREAGL